MRLLCNNFIDIVVVSPGGPSVPEVVECHWCSPAPVGSRPENLHQYWSEDRGQSHINLLVSVSGT